MPRIGKVRGFGPIGAPSTSPQTPELWGNTGFVSIAVDPACKEGNASVHFEGFGKERPIPSRCGIYADSASHGTVAPTRAQWKPPTLFDHTLLTPFCCEYLQKWSIEPLLFHIC
jgi:hypothetical protein